MLFFVTYIAKNLVHKNFVLMENHYNFFLLLGLIRRLHSCEILDLAPLVLLLLSVLEDISNENE